MEKIDVKLKAVRDKIVDLKNQKLDKKKDKVACEKLQNAIEAAEKEERDLEKEREARLGSVVNKESVKHATKVESIPQADAFAEINATTTTTEKQRGGGVNVKVGGIGGGVDVVSKTKKTTQQGK